MTGAELIKWIHENHAEKLKFVQIDDGYAAFPIEPKVRESEEVIRIYVDSAGLRRSGDRECVVV